MFPGVADRAKHQQGIEGQVGGRTHRHQGGRRSGQAVLLEGLVGGAHRVPGRCRGQFGVDQQHSGFVLQGLKGPNGFAELLAGADIVHGGFGAAAYRPRGGACRKGHHQAASPLGRDSRHQ